MIQGDVDTTYQTDQRDMFASGLVAQIGANALTVWMAIKSHADFRTGEARPGVRRLMKVTGLASATVQKGLATLLDAHLLRIAKKRGQQHVYIARERMDVRVGSQVICSIAIDYVPFSMRERLTMLKAASDGDAGAQEIWTHVDVLPGPDLEWDAAAKRLKGIVRLEGAVSQAAANPDIRCDDARHRLRQLANELRLRSRNEAGRVQGGSPGVHAGSPKAAVSGTDTAAKEIGSCIRLVS